MKFISRNELKGDLDRKESFYLVEALPEKYWRDGHIPGSVQIDHTEIKNRAEQLLSDKKSKVVVYCANTECQNSRKAAQLLESLGYVNVYEYVEGKQDWIEAGLPIVSESVS